MANATEEQTHFCDNCKRDIAASNFTMHEVHCRRNIALCTKCKEPFPMIEMEAHYEEEHEETPCKLCKQKFEKREISEHKDICPKRPVICSYCQLDLPFDELKAHTDYCGTRTEQCENCQSYIMLKDQAKHEDTNCEYPPKPEYKPTNVERQALYRERDYSRDPMSTFNTREFYGNRQKIPNRERHFDRNSDRAPMLHRRPNLRSERVNTLIPQTVDDTAEQLSEMNLYGTHHDDSVSDSTRDMDHYDGDVIGRDAREQSYGSEVHADFSRRYPSWQEDEDDLGDVLMLPCEFCAEEYPAFQLHSHQLMCPKYPEEQEVVIAPVTCTDPDCPRHGTNRPAVVLIGLSQPPPKCTNNTEVPFSQDQPKSKTNELDAVNRSDQHSSDEALLPCQYCSELFTTAEFMFHENHCPFGVRPLAHYPEVPTDSLITDPTRSRLVSDYDEDSSDSSPMHSGQYSIIDDHTIPCEFCCLPFKEDEVAVHQVICDVGRALSPSHSDEKNHRKTTRASKLSSIPASKSLFYSKPTTKPSDIGLERRSESLQSRVTSHPATSTVKASKMRPSHLKSSQSKPPTSLIGTVDPTHRTKSRVPNTTNTSIYGTKTPTNTNTSIYGTKTPTNTNTSLYGTKAPINTSPSMYGTKTPTRSTQHKPATSLVHASDQYKHVGLDARRMSSKTTDTQNTLLRREDHPKLDTRPRSIRAKQPSYSVTNHKRETTVSRPSVADQLRTAGTGTLTNSSRLPASTQNRSRTNIGRGRARTTRDLTDHVGSPTTSTRNDPEQLMRRNYTHSNYRDERFLNESHSLPVNVSRHRIGDPNLVNPYPDIGVSGQTYTPASTSSRYK